MENISVCIRIRPKIKEEETSWRLESNSIYNIKSKETFTFDKIIETNTTNNDMFNKTIKDNLTNFVNGINMSVFAYGQTSTGKTFTMRGNDKNPGIIPLAIKEIFKLLEEDKSLSKFVLKASYLELYNEQVNDLLNANNKNLEIRESVQKGVFVNNLTEIQLSNPEKAMQLLKQGDSVRVVAETKLNEKSSRSHSIFRLALEVNKNVENKSKTFFSQINMIDLAGSENVSKAKTDGIRMKEGSNINKSLLALSNVISKLSVNPKNFVNFRDSKLTRLLQNGLSGNSKTTIICTISESPTCYSETLNTLHFGNKAKNIKTDIKINELMDEKSKIMIENNQLKNKIKLLEDMMKEKKEIEEKMKNEKSTSCVSKKSEKLEKSAEKKSQKTELSSFDKIFSDSNSQDEEKKEKMITQLEREINILKRMLISNEEIGEENDANYHDNFSLNSNHYNNPHQLSAQKFQKLSMILSSATKITDSESKQNQRDNTFFEPESMNHQHHQNSIYRRSMSMSEYKHTNPNITSSSMKNFNLNNSSKKTNNNMNQIPSYSSSYSNNIIGSAYKSNIYPTFPNQINQFNAENDIDMILNMNYPEGNMNCQKNNSNNDGYNSAFGFNNDVFNIQLKMENEEIKKNYFELRSKFMETIQIKDNQIKSITANMNLAMDNCEKLIREAEENYMNLKMTNERLIKDLENKDAEVKNMSSNIRNFELMIRNQKDEIEKLNKELICIKNKTNIKDIETELNIFKDKCDNLISENEAMRKFEREHLNQIEKLKIENNHIKISAENFKSENFSYKSQVECLKKSNDSIINDNGRLKHDIESYKNENTSNKDKISKMKGEINSLKANVEKLQNELTLKMNEIKENKKSLTLNSNVTTNTSINKGDFKDKDKNKSSAENIEKLKQKINELEGEIKAKNSHINLLENENNSLKTNLSAFDKNNLIEYERAIEESVNRLKDYEMKMNLANEKLNFYEKMLKISTIKNEGQLNQDAETPSRINLIPERAVADSDYIKTKIINSCTKNQIKNSNAKSVNKLQSNNSIGSNSQKKETGRIYGVSQFNFDEKENINRNSIVQTPKQTESKNPNVASKNNSNIFCSPNKFQVSDSKDFLGKKRHLSKVYQNMIDNNLKSSASDCKNVANISEKKIIPNVHLILKEEKENFKEACFSSFEI